MLWRRSGNSSSVGRSGGQSFGQRDTMGQLSSAELPTVANAVDVQSEEPSTDSKTGPEIGNEAGRLEKLVIRPSQPIDICRGPSQNQPRNFHLQHLQKPMAQRLLQRSASEMTTAVPKCASTDRWAPAGTQKGHHQPRVIQPRRLATNNGNNGIANGTLMGGMISEMGGEGEDNGQINGRQSQPNNGGGHKRTNGLTAEMPTQAKDSAQRGEGPSGGQNKENGDNTGQRSGSSTSSRNSRKRLNSLELGSTEYDALEGTSSAEAKVAEKNHQKLNETKETATEQKQNEFLNGGSQMANDGTTDKKEGDNGTVRRRGEGGRIAYLYGIYGAHRDASTTAFAVTDESHPRQQRRSAFADQANTPGNRDASWDDCCCFEEEAAERDELIKMTRGCLVHSLHTVSDIIGYAKVVRAQRNETLGRLNDVMCQFDALIRSYSLAVKNGANFPRQFDVAAGQSFGGGGGDSANGALQGQTQLEPAA
ncbi:hypothetical protein niasHS_000489 [Heterodera schachtii]|uniref:Uncharacterized protein n=1 Tax=Heterodera schachtii TaxID=97005 RepID=A0ABD2K4E1_HETSC